MSEAVTKSVKVTFHENALPGGTHATFKTGVGKNQQHWTAWPNTKHVGALTVTDHLIGALNAIRRDCIQWINLWPSDATRVAKVLEIIRKADEAAKTGALQKVEVHVS